MAVDNIVDSEDIINILGQELTALEGIHGQHPETASGLGSKSKKSFLGEYTNRLFGAPYQLLDSVDRRFPSINSRLGNEYLRNFILNSPILYIKPGMPHYTGADDTNSLVELIQTSYIDKVVEKGGGDVGTLLTHLGTTIVFGKGARLQKRLFGFRETYYDYMQHVNYMCRSAAVFLGLTEGVSFPNGTFVSGDKFEEFSNMKWENYRLMSNSKVLDPWDYMSELVGSTGVGVVLTSLKETGGNVLEGALNLINPTDGKGFLDAWDGSVKNMSEAWNKATNETMAGHLIDKISSVQFMVEPVQFSESLSNTTESSIIESSIDAISSSVGSEIAFITGSHVDLGYINGITSFLSSGVDTLAGFLGKITEPVTGGFMSSVFNGGYQSIKGQKMIYPKIYKSSDSHMNYEFKVKLTTPYGDIYNYYMNIIVPLLHLIALASPRMVTSNTTTSPFIVQAYIPGMCTCQLGIISQMDIRKNPTGKHVSVNGFPLTVEVTFTIEELYNSMSISPANDPASFLFNETLNDYLANLSGIMPSIDTYTTQRQTMFKNLDEYLSKESFKNEIAQVVIEKAEGVINPYLGR